MQVDNTATGTVVTTPASPAPTPHPLQSTWSFWEHRRNKAGNVVESADASYLAGIQQLCSVSTVEEFWQAFTYLPLPSKFFFDGNVRHDFVDRSVEGFSIFRDGIEPKWESEANSEGGEFFFRGYLPLGDLDMFWEDTLLGLIGETLDPNQSELCGCRIIDKSRVNSGKAHIRAAYRLELWFKTSNDHALREDIKKNWTTCLKDGMNARQKKGSPPKLDYRDHA